MTKTIVRRFAAVLLTVGMTFGVAALGSAPASADSSWGRIAPR